MGGAIPPLLHGVHRDTFTFVMDIVIMSVYILNYLKHRKMNHK